MYICVYWNTYRTVIERGTANSDCRKTGWLRAGCLNVARNGVRRARAVHINGWSGWVGRRETGPSVGRVGRSWWTESLCCSSRGLIVVHHCKWNGEVALVWRRVCSRGGGSGPARGRRPLRMNDKHIGHAHAHASSATRVTERDKLYFRFYARWS